MAQHDMTSHLAIVCHMRVRHQQRVIPDARQRPAALGAPMDGDELANQVVIADMRFGVLAFVLKILRGHAD